jgi:endoglucanase
LQRAKIAYAAAKANPNLRYPDTNVLENPGSGPYNDEHITDEFYWAQCCLFLTTGDPEYLADLRANPYHYGGTANPWSEIGFDWRDTAAWARVQLAVHQLPAGANPNTRAGLRQELRDQANALIAANQPFGQLYSPADNRYAWGSNGMIANNALICGAAYYESGDERYRNAALQGLDYLFGRNALGLSYVTGYGHRYVENQHSRWFAAQKDPSLPHPPPGTLSGGPNSDCPDPASAHLAGSPAQLCFVDDIESYGTNEMTINWNAALVCLLSFACNA